MTTALAVGTLQAVIGVDGLRHVLRRQHSIDLAARSPCKCRQ